MSDNSRTQRMLAELRYYASREIGEIKNVRSVMRGKTYHSIPHLPGSRVGPGDYHLSDGEASLFTSRWETALERVVATEKLDGTCVGIHRLQHTLLPVNRAGYPVWESPREMHRQFGVYVKDRWPEFMGLLKPGERLVGEWMWQAHGIIYDNLPNLFFAFDLWDGKKWIPTLELIKRCAAFGVPTVPLLSYGPPLDPAHFRKLTKRSAFRTNGLAEGLVLRRENNERRLAIAKWVRKEMQPGIYLPEVDGAIVSEPVLHQVNKEGVTLYDAAGTA